jgi:hypothetical protein
MNINKFLKTFLVLLIPIFLFGATVIVIIITQGGKVTEDGIVNETGIIRLNTDPVNIIFDVYIDDKKVVLQNNSSINIVEGEHKVRIETKEMIPWEKIIVVKRGIVNEINVKLFSANLALSKITTSNVDQIFFSSNSGFLFYVIKDSKVPQEKGIWKMQLTTNNFVFFNQEIKPVKFFELSDPKIDVILASTYEIIPTEDGNKIILSDKINKTNLVISSQQNLYGNTLNVIDINDKIGFTPNSIEWMNFDNSILIKEENSLFDYNVNTGILNVIRYSKDTQPIYASNTSQLFIYDTKTSTLLSYKNSLLTTIILPSELLPTNIKRIYLSKINNNYLFIETPTQYVLLDLEKQRIQDISSTVGEIYTIAPDGLGLIVIAPDNSLESYTIKEDLVSNTISIKASKLDVLLEEGNLLKYIPQSSNLLFYEKKTSKILAFDKDGSNKVTLIENPNIVNGFDFDNTGRNLFVILVDEKTEEAKPNANIYKINIVQNQ